MITVVFHIPSVHYSIRRTLSRRIRPPWINGWYVSCDGSVVSAHRKARLIFVLQLAQYIATFNCPASTIRCLVYNTIRFICVRSIDCLQNVHCTLIVRTSSKRLGANSVMFRGLGRFERRRNVHLVIEQS